MSLKSKEGNINLFYMDSNKGQDKRAEKKSAPKKKKNNIKQNKKKNNKVEKKDDIFNFDTEIVLGISNKEKDNEKNKENIRDKVKRKSNQEVKQKKKNTNKEKKNIKNENNNINERKNTNNKKNNQMIKKNKRKNRISFMLFFTKWTILIGMLFGATIFLLTTPLFNIRQIQVIGNITISKDEIISLSQLKLNQNIFDNKKNNIIRNIKVNSYIESVEVKRKIPDVMEITIKERQPNYCIKILNSYAYIDKQGYILEVTEQYTELIELIGMKTEAQNIIAGERLCNEDLERLGIILKILESTKSIEISDIITQIDLTNIHNYTLYLKNKTIYLGDTSNLSTKMLYVKAILDAEEENEGEIFVNGNLNEGFKPYFREKV